MNKKGVAILGSTGSIGRSTLDVIRGNPQRFRVVTLSAGKNSALIKRQIEEFCPAFVSVMTREAAEDIKRRLPSSSKTEVGFGAGGLKKAATFDGADIVVSAIAGAAGFLPTFEAIRAGKDVALANKETLVIGGPLVMREVKKRRVKLLPVDSEHSAIFQALEGHRAEDIRRLILTASGGPFLNLPFKRFKSVTPREALRHPTWKMGRRITVDSATLMNKGFEVIEARWLFDVEAEKIEVVVHPQSIVHSMVEYIDGSIVAQMGASDMRGPISYALSHPERITSGVKPLSLAGKTLEFFDPDRKRFPCLRLAYEALKYGESAPVALNAADEVCVDMFLKGAIRFTDIPEVIETTLSRHSPSRVKTVDDILDADRWGRLAAEKIIKKRMGK